LLGIVREPPARERSRDAGRGRRLCSASGQGVYSGPSHFHEPVKCGIARPVEVNVPELGNEPFSATVPIESSDLPALSALTCHTAST